jgi:hypothetical protein
MAENKELSQNNLCIQACPACPELRWKNLRSTKEHCVFPPCSEQPVLRRSAHFISRQLLTVFFPIGLTGIAPASPFS